MTLYSLGRCQDKKKINYLRFVQRASLLLLKFLLVHFLTIYLCRFTFVVAFLLLLGGAALNDQHGVENEYFSYYYCYVVKPGVFAVSAALCLASVTLGIFYYLTISSGKETPFGGPAAPNQTGIAMGQAQVPPTSHDPVFVHEDTYVRRQFT